MRESLFTDARTGQPKTSGGTFLLRLIAVAQIVLSVVLLPAAALWYGLHEVPGFLRESMRPAVKTLWHGKSGPY
jgi:hypothetical protein